MKNKNAAIVDALKGSVVSEANDATEAEPLVRARERSEPPASPPERKYRDADYRPFLKNTRYKLKDKVFNWVLMRHTAAGHKRKWYSLYLKKGEMQDGMPWEENDEWFWKIAVYKLPSLIGTLVFIYVIYLIGNFTYNHYGAWRAALVLTVMVLIRINTLIKLQARTNELLGENAENLEW